MPDATLPLDDLTQQIAQHQSQLERLRQEFETRQARLSDLAQKRDQLRAQLRQVEADIQAETRGSPPAAPAPKSPAKEANRPTLTDALVKVAREANRAITAKELAEELSRRKFPTTSENITNLVHSHLAKLVKRGVFRRAEGQPGVVLAALPNGSAKAPAPAPRGRRKGQPSLASLLTGLLQKSRKPMAARDLAQQVLAKGYQTGSKNFTDVVWTALGQLEGVENVKGQGWRMKKS